MMISLISKVRGSIVIGDKANDDNFWAAQSRGPCGFGWLAAEQLYPTTPSHLPLDCGHRHHQQNQSMYHFYVTALHGAITTTTTNYSRCDFFIPPTPSHIPKKGPKMPTQATLLFSTLALLVPKSYLHLEIAVITIAVATNTN